jgi:hypothetical protein
MASPAKLEQSGWNNPRLPAFACRREIRFKFSERFQFVEKRPMQSWTCRQQKEPS